MADTVTPNAKAQELASIIQEIRERVRSRMPDAASGIALPDLLPVLHARDAAEGKVAAIGNVNPRPAGALNSLIQSAKRNIARGLNWFVRDQIDFNQASVDGLSAVLDAFNENNRVLAALAARIEEQKLPDLDGTLRAMTDRQADWEQRLVQAELSLLRSVASLSAQQQQRFSDLDSTLRRYFDSRLRESAQTASAETQDAAEAALAKVRAEFAAVREDYERLIHQELRMVRQRSHSAGTTTAAATGAASAARPVEFAAFDYTRFADRFRGSEEDIRERMRRYVPLFAGCKNAVDVGCGRGEFLSLLRENGIEAQGIDLDDESVRYCQSQGLRVTKADLFSYLPANGPFDGIFCAQVIEHLPPDTLPRFVQLCAETLVSGGVVAFETPNPECLAIFSSHFYIDPTHTRPVPIQLMVFYLEEFGFGSIGVQRLSPAIESMPSLSELPPAFRDAFFGGLDYAIYARKL